MTNGESTQQYFGGREHAMEIGHGRHPGVQDALQWLTFSHLPPELRAFSAPFYAAACELVERVASDSPELTTALNLLIQAKDSAVRAGIKSRTGRAGSIPRPQTVVDPPLVSAAKDVASTRRRRHPASETQASAECDPACVLAGPHYGDCKTF
jgi:hypothetical protein